MRFPSITISQTEDGHLEVSATGFRTGALCVDEALGCIASALYGDKENLPQFMRSDLWHARDQRRYGKALDHRSIIALLASGESVTRCAACNGRGDVQVGEDRTCLGMWQNCAACGGKGWVG